MTDEISESYDEQNGYSSGRNRKKPNKSSKTTYIVLAVLLILIAGVFIYIKNYMPDILLQRGISYMQSGNYKKALGMFDTVANMLPLDERPVNYQVEALSKLPPTYENQKALYEISQYDDFDAATERAEQVLSQIRQNLNNEIGANFVDNVLYEERLIRWNNREPITYSISYNGNTPPEYIDAVREAFQNWQNATNGEISFRDTPGNTNANITVSFTNSLKTNTPALDKRQSGSSIPSINNNMLNKVDIYIKPSDQTGLNMDRNEVFNIAQHEIGHALGLWGHSADSSDVMYYDGDLSGNHNPKMITTRDLNTLRAVYRMNPDIIDKPLAPEQLSNLYFHNILTSYAGENFEKDIQRIVELLRQDKGNIAAWVDLAINYGFLRDYSRSNYILENILPLVSTDFQNQFVVLYNMSANFYKMKDYYNSRKYLDLAVQLGDDFDTQLLDAFLDVKEFNKTNNKYKLDTAEKKLIALQKSYPDNIEVALKLVEVYFKKEDQKSQDATIDKLISNNPQAIYDRRVARYKSQSRVKITSKI